jgi:Ca2+-transporting ATPase
VFVAVALMYAFVLASGGEDRARAMAFTALVFGNLALILVNRSSRLTAWEALGNANPALWWIVAATLGALALVIYVPAAAEVFRFAALGPRDAAIAAGAGLGSVLWFDVVKALVRRD